MRPAEFDEQPELFTGEHIFPWLFEDYGALAPARDVGRTSSRRTSGRGCTTRRCWRANTVPVAAAIYTEDLYVERALLRGDGRGARPTCTAG